MARGASFDLSWKAFDDALELYLKTFDEKRTIIPLSDEPPKKRVCNSAPLAPSMPLEATRQQVQVHQETLRRMPQQKEKTKLWQVSMKNLIIRADSHMEPRDKVDIFVFA
jgi:hypothetical protein